MSPSSIAVIVRDTNRWLDAAAASCATGARQRKRCDRVAWARAAECQLAGARVALAKLLPQNPFSAQSKIENLQSKISGGAA